MTTAVRHPGSNAAAGSLTGPDSLGYLTRSSGLVLLLLFTAAVVLGLLTAGRARPAGWPRFVVQSLHRNLSVLSVVLLIVHLAAPIIGGYLGVRLAYAFVPFLPGPIRIWTRLAAAATDLILLTAVASALRHRAGYRLWRAVHLTTYLAWVLAVVHGTGVGTDRTSVVWCDVVCVTAVAAAAGARLATARRLARQRYP